MAEQEGPYSTLSAMSTSECVELLNHYTVHLKL